MELWGRDEEGGEMETGELGVRRERRFSELTTLHDTLIYVILERD